jgi:hypothetical protein
MSTITYDLEWLKSAEIKDLHAALRNPAALATVNALLRTPEGAIIAYDMINTPSDKYVPVSKRAPEENEEAAIAADVALADTQAALDAAAVAPAAVAPAPLVEEKKKIVVDYQATAEDDAPIGRPTHIEGWDYPEVIEKVKAAHINAVRYAERMKKAKVQGAQSHIERQQVRQAAAASQAEADIAMQEAAKDVTKLPDAVKKITAADRAQKIADETARQHGVIVADLWLADHKEDFVVCDANNKIIGEWIKSAGPNGTPLEWTYDNLELAFEANKARLARPTYVAPVVETSAPPANNPPAAVPAVAVAAPIAPVAPTTVGPASNVETPASQPASATTAPTSVAATNAPAARRPGVNGSLPPGSLSAQRPSVSQEPVASTRSELLRQIAKMPREEYRKQLKNAKFVAQLEAAGIPVVGQRA